MRSVQSIGGAVDLFTLLKSRTLHRAAVVNIEREFASRRVEVMGAGARSARESSIESGKGILSMISTGQCPHLFPCLREKEKDI